MGWRWGKKLERPGPAEEVVEAVAEELEAAYPKERLREMIMAHARG